MKMIFRKGINDSQKNAAGLGFGMLLRKPKFSKVKGGERTVYLWMRRGGDTRPLGILRFQPYFCMVDV